MPTSQTIPKENKMGVMPVNRLLITMSLPMMISMLVQALYNIVDSVFVSQISENALTAVSLAFPIQNVMISVGAGTGVGINALLSRELGQKNYKQANRIADNAVVLSAFSFLIFLVFGLTLPHWFFSIQSDSAEIIQMGSTYLTICCTFSFGLFGQFLFERLVQSTGKTIFAMITQGLGAVLNIILDPILIFGLIGFPKMGIAGAAVATVIGQIAAALLGLFFQQRYNHEVRLSRGIFKPHLATIGKIYAIGIPSIIMTSIGSVMTFCMNKILMAFSSTAVAVFGVFFKLQSFVFMPIFGLNNGMVPILSYNYGAQKRERILKTIRLSVIYAVGLMLLGLAVMQLLPKQLLLFFKPSDDMIRMGVPALRIMSTAFLFAGAAIILGSVFQAFGHAVKSLIVSVARQLVVLLPAAYLLSLTKNLDLVWLAFPIAEVASIFLTIIFYRTIRKKVIMKIPAENAVEEAPEKIS